MDAVVVSLGDNISASTLITLLLDEMKVKNILVKAIDEEHGKILSKVGATEVVFPERDMGIKIAKSLIIPNVLDFLPMTKDYEIAELVPPDTFCGKTLTELELPQKLNIQVIAIKELVPENLILVPKADFVVKDSEVLVVLGKAKDIERIREKL